MILFQFEFERRELYGVFQACSDGAMNIVPHVLGLSGKQYPAQVRRLLSLFSLKRKEDKAPPRRLIDSKIARQSGFSTSKNRRLVDKSPMRNQVPSEYGVDNHYEPNISSIHQGDSF